MERRNFVNVFGGALLVASVVGCSGASSSYDLGSSGADAGGTTMADHEPATIDASGDSAMEASLEDAATDSASAPDAAVDADDGSDVAEDAATDTEADAAITDAGGSWDASLLADAGPDVYAHDAGVADASATDAEATDGAASDAATEASTPGMVVECGGAYCNSDPNANDCGTSAPKNAQCITGTTCGWYFISPQVGRMQECCTPADYTNYSPYPGNVIQCTH